MPSKDFQTNIRLWLSGSDSESDSGFGDGRIRLLESIEKNGSLSKASESLGISYRKAWGDIKKLEELIGDKLLIKTRGGQSGGEMKLTDAGFKWIQAYNRFRDDVELAASKAYDSHLSGLAEEISRGQND